MKSSSNYHGHILVLYVSLLQSLPAAVGHLMSTVEHSHQGFLVVNARKSDDDGSVGSDQVQVAFGEVKINGLK